MVVIQSNHIKTLCYWVTLVWLKHTLSQKAHQLASLVIHLLANSWTSKCPKQFYCLHAKIPTMSIIQVSPVVSKADQTEEPPSTELRLLIIEVMVEHCVEYVSSVVAGG